MTPHLVVALAVVGLAANAAVVTPTAVDAPTSFSQHLASRKDRAVGDAEEGEIETLATLYNVHTDEALVLSEAEPMSDRFSGLLADRVTGSTADIDPRLLEMLRAVARRNAGARLEIVSGYRSAKLNEMLRKKGHNVASHSQHSLGHACDFRIEGRAAREMEKDLDAIKWEGGIGRYDKESDEFVHVDVGEKRRWTER